VRRKRGKPWEFGSRGGKGNDLKEKVVAQGKEPQNPEKRGDAAGPEAAMLFRVRREREKKEIARFGREATGNAGGIGGGTKLRPIIGNGGVPSERELPRRPGGGWLQKRRKREKGAVRLPKPNANAAQRGDSLRLGSL